ncbi:MAG: RidA family protein, partial [Rhodanobacter sp.]
MPPSTYSQAVKAAGLVFVSGTAPQDPATGAVTGTTIQEQTRRPLANIVAVLTEAGSSLDDSARQLPYSGALVGGYRSLNRFALMVEVCLASFRGG